MNEGEVRLMNFPSLLHFAEDGGVFFSTTDKKKATGFTIESADEGKKFIGVLVAEPVDQRESAVGAGGVNQPAGRFIDDQKRDVFQHDRGIHKRRLVQRVVWVEAEDSRCVGWGDGVRRWYEGKGISEGV